MKYDHLDMLPERAFQPHSKYGMTLEGGGPSSSTTYSSSGPPNWLRPQTQALIGAATQEYFNVDPEGNITSVKPYTPYSTRPEDYVAAFSPQQQAVFRESAGMQRPGQFQDATQLAGMAGRGGLESAGRAYGYGQRAADIGEMALGAERYGRDVGEEARQFARQAAMTGRGYEARATDPFAVQAYMSPYQQNVIDLQKQAAMRDYGIRQAELGSQAARAGAFGGGRQAIQKAEAERNLMSTLANIEGQGLQSAYDRAIQSMQYGTGQGLAGLQAAQSGLGTALQGGQLGLSGIGQAIAGQQAGLQGVSGAQAGYGLAGQAGTNLANIGTAQQQADLARMGFQSEMGAMQQAREQQIINQAVQNYAMAQENPFQRLSQYSGLIRGYATPTTTVSQYTASPSFAQTAAGGAALAYGIGQAGKKKGGKVEEEGIDSLALYNVMKKRRAA